MTDGTPPVEYQFPDDTRVERWIGFYVVERSPSGTVDFTLDNSVAVGTTTPTAP